MKKYYELIVGLGLLTSTVLGGYAVYKVHNGKTDNKDKIIGWAGVAGLSATCAYGLIKNPLMDNLNYKSTKLEKDLTE
jgi:hypothetical protein